MKTEIHPQYFINAQVTCACGNKFLTGSTRETIRVEICSNCHPFYTGQAKFVDTEGRVEAFKRREAKKEEPRAKKVQTKEQQTPRTLKEMLSME